MLRLRLATPFLALILAAGGAAAATTEAPCAATTGHDRLLSWVGQWQVTNEAGEPLAVARVAPVAGQCAFEEVVARADGSEEFGLIYLDRADATWRQRWISSLGHSGRIELSFTPDRVTTSGRVHPVEGGEVLMRSTITPRAGGGFTQELTLSLDGGATYSEPERTHYLPPGAPAPADDESKAMPAPQAPAPAPLETPAGSIPAVQPALPAEPAVEAHGASPGATPGQAGAEEAPAAASAGVRVRSKRKTAAPVPETAMESPMTLEFELGPLADLPPGAGWRTEEMAPYVADQVNITRITAQRRQRRGKVELELVVNLRTRAGQSKVDVDVTLFSDGGDVVSERVEGVTLGKLIKAHDPTEGLPLTVRLPVDGDAFEALFAGGARPSVRLTVTVR